MKIEKIKVSDLKPYKNNAKIHTPEQVEQIKKSIQEFGFNDPIAVDENNMIVEGHGRLLAVKALGYTEVDCIRLDGMTDEQKRAYIHVHNQLTLNTGFDLGILESELKSIESIDMELFGFDIGEIDDFDFNELDAEDNKKETYTINIKFDKKSNFDKCKNEIETIVESFEGRMSVKME